MTSQLEFDSEIRGSKNGTHGQPLMGADQRGWTRLGQQQRTGRGEAGVDIAIDGGLDRQLDVFGGFGSLFDAGETQPALHRIARSDDNANAGMPTLNENRAAAAAGAVLVSNDACQTRHSDRHS